MSLETKYSDPRGVEEPAVLVSIGSNIRFGDFGITMSAGGGETAASTIQIDDPGGIYTFVGLRAFEVRESSAASNNQVIGRFVVQDREVGRDEDRGFLTGKDRLWSMDLTDYNWHLGKRILVDSDSNRPAETSGDRIRWLLTNADHISLNDYGHVTYPSANMDANDYRGMRAADVLVDCAVEEQYNFWVRFNEAHGRPELFFMDPNGSSYASAVTISNFIADVDGLTTFAPYRDAKLRRSPTRIAYGVYVPFDGGNVYVRKDSTGDQFGLQDQTAPSGTIHTAAKARRVGTAFLNANDSETDVITVAIKVPAAQVNDIIEGQRLAVKFTHLPGYEAGRWTRVTQRSVIQEEQGGGQYYLLDLTLIPSGGAATVPTIPPATAHSTAGGILYEPGNTGGPLADFPLFWRSTGDNPGPGYSIVPRDAASFNYTGAVPSVAGWTILAASATLNLSLQITMIDVTASRIYTFELRKNGATIATDVFNYVGGLTAVLHTFNIDVAGVAVVAGDLLSAHITTAAATGLIVPSGTGDLSNRFLILNTSTVVR